MKILWFIPTHGDSRYLGTHAGRARRRASTTSAGRDRRRQPRLRRRADPHRPLLRGPVGVAASLIDATRRLKFLVALRPGLVQPALAARMAATFDRLSGGRLLINLVTGGDADELEGDGLFLDHAERYEQSREFLRIWREVLARSHADAGQRFDYFEGTHLSVKGAQAALSAAAAALSAALLRRLVARPRTSWRRSRSTPTSPGASRRRRWPRRSPTSRARRAPRPHAELRHPAARDRARDRGRGLARRRRADLAPRRRPWSPPRRRASRAWTRSASAAWPRCTAAASTSARRAQGLEIAPNLWAGVGLVRGGAGTALVGNPRAGGRAHRGVRGARPRHLHPLRLSAPRGGAPLRRAGVPAAAARAQRKLPAPDADRAVRRDRRQQPIAPQRVAKPEACTAVLRSSAVVPLARCPCRCCSLCWQLAVAGCGWLSTRVLPEPLAVVERVLDAARPGELWQHVATSTGRALAGLRDRRRPRPRAGPADRLAAARPRRCSTPRCRWCATSRRWR